MNELEQLLNRVAELERHVAELEEIPAAIAAAFNDAARQAEQQTGAGS